MVFNCKCDGKDTVKPIFHCGAKPLALGASVGLDSQHHDFVLPIPTCWYLNTLKCVLPQRETPTQISGI